MAIEFFEAEFMLASVGGGDENMIAEFKIQQELGGFDGEPFGGEDFIGLFGHKKNLSGWVIG
jgi:hypothetical protein